MKRERRRRNPNRRRNHKQFWCGGGWWSDDWMSEPRNEQWLDHGEERKTFLITPAENFSPSLKCFLALRSDFSPRSGKVEIQQFPVVHSGNEQKKTERTRRRLNLKQCYRTPTLSSSSSLPPFSPSPQDTLSHVMKSSATFLSRTERAPSSHPSTSLSPSVIDASSTQRKKKRKIHQNEKREINFHLSNPLHPLPRSFSSDSWYQSLRYFKNKRNVQQAAGAKLERFAEKLSREKGTKIFSNLIFV